MSNYEKEIEFIRNNFKGSGADINPNNLMNSFNKSEIIGKLRQLGMGAAADKLSLMSEDDIIRLINSNPQILKKAADILNDRR